MSFNKLSEQQAQLDETAKQLQEQGGLEQLALVTQLQERTRQQHMMECQELSRQQTNLQHFISKVKRNSIPKWSATI